MKTIRALIVDDEANARNVLAWFLKTYFDDTVEVVACAADMTQAVELFHRFSPNTIFLDIEMPRLSGIEIHNELGAYLSGVHIVFVTAHAQYAVTAFQLNASNYLLKPLKLPDLRRAILKIVADIETANRLTASEPAKLVFHSGYETIIVDAAKVLFVKSEGPYLDIHIEGEKPVIINKRMHQFCQETAELGFFQIHRSYSINVKKIQKVLRSDHLVVMSDHSELPISRERRAIFFDYLITNGIKV